MALPVLKRLFRPGAEAGLREARGLGTVTALNDQHAYIQLEQGADLAVGDLVSFGISHPCTTFDKWELLYLVDEDLNIVDAIKIWF